MTINVFLHNQYKQKGVGRFLESLELPYLNSENNPFKTVYYESLEETSEHKCDIAIYGGMLPQDLELSSASENKFYAFCSPFGQADMSSPDFYSAETVILINAINMIKTGKLRGVITSSKSLATRFGFIYIPMTRKLRTDQVKFTFDRENYSLLGNNLRKHRNVVNQLAAISTLTPKMPIIVSNPEMYQYYAQLFDCQVAGQKLENDDDYFSSIAHHKLTFQCNFSESFSYLAYEYGIQGVPCICSHSIDWYPVKECIVNNPDSWQEIYTKTQLLLSDESLYRDCSYQIAEFCLKMAKRNSEWLKEVVDANFIKLS